MTTLRREIEDAICDEEKKVEDNPSLELTPLVADAVTRVFADWLHKVDRFVESEFRREAGE